jgi:KDO2-lipid IV(A) lauroyltransferase
VVNPEVLNRFHDQGKSVIVVTGHIGNWEWGSLSAGLFTNYNVVAFYSPMRNKPIDRIMRWSRSRFGTILSPTKGTTNTYAANKDNYPVLFAEIERIKRGYYELKLKVLTEKPVDTAQGEITHQYAAILEDYIRRHPDNWLWSHRRWKRKQPQEQESGQRPEVRG